MRLWAVVHVGSRSVDVDRNPKTDELSRKQVEEPEPKEAQWRRMIRFRAEDPRPENEESGGEGECKSVGLHILQGNS